MNALASILAALAVELLDYLLNRKGIRDNVKLSIALRTEQLAKKAEKYKADNPVNLDDLPASLRLRKRTKRV